MSKRWVVLDVPVVESEEGRGKGKTLIIIYKSDFIRGPIFLLFVYHCWGLPRICDRLL